MIPIVKSKSKRESQMSSEDRNRYLKAEKLAQTILATAKDAGLGPLEAIGFAKVATPAEWSAVAAKASEAFKQHVNPPNPKNPQPTIDEIIRQLEGELTDPFAGLELAGAQR